MHTGGGVWVEVGGCRLLQVLAKDNSPQQVCINNRNYIAAAACSFAVGGVDHTAELGGEVVVKGTKKAAVAILRHVGTDKLYMITAGLGKHAALEVVHLRDVESADVRKKLLGLKQMHDFSNTVEHMPETIVTVAAPEFAQLRKRKQTTIFAPAGMQACTTFMCMRTPKPTC